MNNPIIQRELIGMLRSSRALWIQLGMVVLLSLFVVIKWPTESQVDMNHLASRQVLRVFGYCMLACMILIAPIFPATSIVRERSSGTLALLLNSAMNPISILIGKLTGVVGFTLLLLLLSVPAAAATVTMGGIGFREDIFPVYGVLAVLTIQYGTLGLLVSTFATRADSALRLTYFIVLLLAVVAAIPHQFLADSPAIGPQMRNAVGWLRCLSPVSAMADALGHQLGTAGHLETGNVAGRYLLIGTASSIVFSIATAMRLHGGMLDRTFADGRRRPPSPAMARVRRVMFLWLFDPTRRTRLIGSYTNPVLIKEFRSRRFGRSRWLLRLICICLMVSLLLVLATLDQVMDRQGEVAPIGSILAVLQMVLLALITPTLASGLISSEREIGGWDLMRMTPLSATRIVTGKLLSVGITLGLVLLATLPGYAVLILLQRSYVVPVSRVVVTLLLSALFMVLLSAALSSLFKRTAAATTAAYVLLGGLFAGTLLIWASRDAPFSHGTVQAVLCLNPLAASLSLIDAPGFRAYELVPMNWWFLVIVSSLCLLTLLVQTRRLTRPD